MNLVMKRTVAFWNNENLVVCFVEALSYLTEGLERDDIRDVFFPEVGTIVENVQGVPKKRGINVPA